MIGETRIIRRVQSSPPLILYPDGVIEKLPGRVSCHSPSSLALQSPLEPPLPLSSSRTLSHVSKTALSVVDIPDNMIIC